MHRAVFLDRDGTIARDVHYCRRVEDFEILPRVPEAIRLLNQRGYKIVVITNQSGIARGYFSEATLSLIHRKMVTTLEQSGAHIDAVYVCPHHPDEGCDCRKPSPTLIVKAAADIGIVLDQSYMIGDDPKDVKAGRAARCRTILLTADPARHGDELPGICDHTAADLFEAVGWLLADAARHSPEETSVAKGKQAP